MSKTLFPKGGNDKIYTSPEVAQKIVNHFKPYGECLEPCAGGFAFVNALTDYVGIYNVDWMEIDSGKDFLLQNPPRERYDWIFSNYPFSLYRKFLQKSLTLANNLILLSPTMHVLALKARRNDIKKQNFFVREICELKETPKEFPSSGFIWSAIHLSIHEGDCKFSEL